MSLSSSLLFLVFGHCEILPSKAGSFRLVFSIRYTQKAYCSRYVCPKYVQIKKLCVKTVWFMATRTTMCLLGIIIVSLIIIIIVVSSSLLALLIIIVISGSLAIVPRPLTWFAFSRQSTLTLSWFSLILRASRLFLAARLFFRRRSQYLASCCCCCCSCWCCCCPEAEEEEVTKLGSDSVSDPTGLNSAVKNLLFKVAVAIIV